MFDSPTDLDGNLAFALSSAFFYHGFLFVLFLFSFFFSFTFSNLATCFSFVWFPTIHDVKPTLHLLLRFYFEPFLYVKLPLLLRFHFDFEPFPLRESYPKMSTPSKTPTPIKKGRITQDELLGMSASEIRLLLLASVVQDKDGKVCLT